MSTTEAPERPRVAARTPEQLRAFRDRLRSGMLDLAETTPPKELAYSALESCGCCAAFRPAGEAGSQVAPLRKLLRRWRDDGRTVVVLPIAEAKVRFERECTHRQPNGVLDELIETCEGTRR